MRSISTGFCPLSRVTVLLACVRLCLMNVCHGALLPAGFAETDLAVVNNPVGIAFGKNSGGTKERLYVWDRWGSVWIIEEGVKLPEPLLAINDEVADYSD